MKKNKILLICTLILMLTCMMLASCSRNEKVTSISLKNEGAIEIAAGRLEYSEHMLLVNYSSGSVIEVPLSENMFSELDILKLYQPGEHVITASYGGQKCQIGVSVKRATFGELKFPENTVFTYDGTEHVVEIEGELPSNATVTYPGGNSFINAGTYDVTAVVSCNGYETARVTTKVTVERAKYDMSGVKLESKEVTYNGKPQFITISGKLPSGVSDPTYYINDNKVSSVTDAGEYTVTAVFAAKDPNYAPIEDMKATLKINPAEYSLDDAELTFKTASGALIFTPWKSYDGKTVKFDFHDNGAFGKNVNVSYSVLNESGEVISRSNTETNIKNAGKYTVRVEFTLLDGKNYKQIEPLEFPFEIDKAKFDVTKVEFSSTSFEYDGEKHSIFVDLPSELDASNIEIKYEYILNGEVLLENGSAVTGVSQAGEYTVNAIFTVNNSNYADIEPMQAKLVIEKKKVASSWFDFSESSPSEISKGESGAFEFIAISHEGVNISACIYKVEAEELTAVIEPTSLTPDENGRAVIELETAELEAGAYACIFTVTVTDENYILSTGSTFLDYRFNFEIVN
jgi:hypothetical protein